MNLQDLIVTPIFLFLILAGGWMASQKIRNKSQAKWLLPALGAKCFGAIAIGIIYQFYYEGGDTYTYHTHGSRLIWQAFMDNPINGFRLIFFTDKDQVADLFEYTQQIWYYRNLGSSYNVCRITALIDLFTFSTYSATALLFALWSFSGWWRFFRVIDDHYPKIKTQYLAIAIFFIPSVVAWGSGIFKDTLTLGALGWFIWALFLILEKKKIGLSQIITIVGSALVIGLIKSYILISLVPLTLLWVYLKNMSKMKNSILRLLIAPILIIGFLGVGYIGIELAATTNEKYSLGNVAETAKITAYDLRYGWGARNGDNSGYTLGELDGTWGSLIVLFPQAVNVTLFRPYIWEVSNPLMLLSALESLIFFLLTMNILLNRRTYKRISHSDPFLFSILVFSLVFAFAVGVSTFNFGTLVRYKIPILPLFAIAILMLKDRGKETQLRK